MNINRVFINTAGPALRTALWRPEVWHSVWRQNNTAYLPLHCPSNFFVPVVHPRFLCSNISIAHQYSTRAASQSAGAVAKLPSDDCFPAENEFINNILRTYPAYSVSTCFLDTLFDDLQSAYDMNAISSMNLQTDWATYSPVDLAKIFIAMSCTGKLKTILINNKSFISSMCNALPSISDKYLQDVLSSLKFSLPIRDSSFLFQQLDLECIRRVKNWSVNDAFKVAHIWTVLNLYSNSAYIRVMLAKTGIQVPSMTPPQVVQYLFYMHISRQRPPISFFHLENKIATIIKDLSIEEISVIALGLFKVQANLGNYNLIGELFDIVLNWDSSSASSLALSSFCKALRSRKFNFSDKLIQVQERLLPQLPHFDLKTQCQIALLGNHFLIFHPQLVEAIACNFIENISLLRLKEIERLCLVLMIYNFIPEKCRNILQFFAQELRHIRRKEEVICFPKSFSATVYYMAVLGYLPMDLVSLALNPAMVRAVENFGYSPNDRELLELDLILDMDAPKEYKGNRLQPAVRERLMSVFVDTLKVPSRKPKDDTILTRQEAFTLRIDKALSALFQDEAKVFVNIVLPYSSCPVDIVFCTDIDKNPMKIPAEYLALSHRAIKRPVSMCLETGKQLLWTVVVPVGRNHLISGGTRVRGQLQMKIRHLQQLGYTVVQVPWSSTNNKSRKNLVTHMKDLLLQAGVIASSR